MTWRPGRRGGQKGAVAVAVDSDVTTEFRLPAHCKLIPSLKKLRVTFNSSGGAYIYAQLHCYGAVATIFFSSRPPAVPVRTTLGPDKKNNGM